MLIKTKSNNKNIRAWFISLHVQAVMPVMLAKPSDIFPHAYVST